MDQTSENHAFWFAARVRHCQEFAVKNALERLGIQCYIPMHSVERKVKSRLIQVQVPAIPNLVFVYTNKELACSAANEYGVPLYYISDLYTRTMLIIPSKQMSDFIFTMQHLGDRVVFEDNPIAIGESVMVTEGVLRGVEGEMVRRSGRTHMIIRIPHVLSAIVRIPRKFLKIKNIERR